ncbi:glycosyltransferase family 2 protein [Aeromonas salmonicida]|uniref:glycosyltransferase family 2 protein n=1 Tax=Aeromonas salmonicida TaxID=645 RepID=UPI003CE91DE1
MIILTVLMPVFNAEAYIAEAICSILSQTYRDFKFIILDDCSTDKSFEIAESFRAIDSRIILRRHATNQGIAKSRDELLSLVDTEYFAWMDADDISFPQRFRVQIDYLISHPEIGAVSSGYMCMDTLKVYMPETNTDMISVNLLTSNCIVNPAAMVRKEVADRTVFSYEHCGVTSATDYAFWVAIRDVSKLKVIPECLLLYRVHQQQESIFNVKNQQHSAKKIVAQQFFSLGIKVDGALLPELILFPGDKPSRSSLIKIGNLYCLLMKINKGKNFYPSSMLLSSLSARYMGYCKFFGLSGVFNYLKFMGFRSLLDKNRYGLNFIIRCLTYK